MCVYLHNKFQVSSIIPATLWTEGKVYRATYLPTFKQTPKKPTQVIAVRFLNIFISPVLVLLISSKEEFYYFWSSENFGWFSEA